jgi:hypothetical protein
VVEVTGPEVTVGCVEVKVTVTNEVGVLTGVELVGEADNVVEVDEGTAEGEGADVTVLQPAGKIANKSIRRAKILKNLFMIFFL